MGSLTIKSDTETTENKNAASNLLISRATELIADADSLIITAGAGMGVDSGLPDFRGTGGFWNIYPALARAQMRFDEIACPGTFENNPRLAWGFYGHRLNLYRNTEPHKGFQYLHTIVEHLAGGAFVYSSNVDGHFQKSGFSENRIVECHGSINFLQCQNTCTQELWETIDFMPEVDEEHCILTSTFPVCKDCGGIARPNILMFSDMGWVNWRARSQIANFHEWRETVRRPVVVEIGAGKYIPRVREFGQSLNVPLIRINLANAEVDRSGDVALKVGALEGITAIIRHLIAMDFIKEKY